MPLIVGLGNPGANYDGTPHNVGFDVVARLARRAGVGFRRSPSGQAEEAIWPGLSRVILLRPMAFMNLSGGVVSAALRWHRTPLSELFVICDDVNLPLGCIRIRVKGGAGGQKGLLSVIEVLDSEEFARMRIGVGGGDTGADVARHVLKKFSRSDSETIDSALETAADAVECYLRDGLEMAMNRYNTKRSSPDSDIPSGGDIPPDEFSPKGDR